MGWRERGGTVRTESERDRILRQSSFPRTPRAVQHTTPRGVTVKTNRTQCVHPHDAPDGVTHRAHGAAPSAHRHRPMSSDSEDSDGARSHTANDGAAAVSTHAQSAPRTQSAEPARSRPLTARLARCECVCVVSRCRISQSSRCSSRPPRWTPRAWRSPSALGRGSLASHRSPCRGQLAPTLPTQSQRYRCRLYSGARSAKRSRPLARSSHCWTYPQRRKSREWSAAQHSAARMR